MRVLKFGGSSLKDYACLQSVGALVKDYGGSKGSLCYRHQVA